MKHIYYLILAATIFSACKSSKVGQNPKCEIDNKNFIPYSVGTYWIYESSDGYSDTLKVMSNEKIDKGIKVNLNFEKWLMVSEDSIFVRCNTRGGGEFTMPLYLKIKDKAEYETCLGDVVTRVEAQRITGPIAVNGKAYTDCTEYFIKPYTKVIVADRVGPIKFTYLDINGELKSERQLKEFKVKP